MPTRKKIKPRRRQFEVPKEFVKTFLDHVEDTGLEYTLSEVDEHENLVIYVEYSSEAREDIMNLIEVLDEYLEQEEEEESEEEEGG